jgi:hypothetical protein
MLHAISLDTSKCSCGGQHSIDRQRGPVGTLLVPNPPALPAAARNAQMNHTAEIPPSYWTHPLTQPRAVLYCYSCIHKAGTYVFPSPSADQRQGLRPAYIHAGAGNRIAATQLGSGHPQQQPAPVCTCGSEHLLRCQTRPAGSYQVYAAARRPTATQLLLTRAPTAPKAQQRAYRFPAPSSQQLPTQPVPRAVPAGSRAQDPARLPCQQQAHFHHHSSHAGRQQRRQPGRS